MKRLLIFILSFCAAFCMQGQNFSSDSVPVRLRYLTATQLSTSTKLQWSVVCLLDYAKFDIQRSSDGVTYKSIYQFQADKTRCISAFEHEDISGNGRFFYRIRVGDLDSRYYTSKTIVVYGREKGFEITSLSPTVAYNSILLSVSSATNDRVETSITDIKGNIIRRKNYLLLSGNNDLIIDGNSIGKGVYIITIINQSGQKKVSRFIKH